MSDLGHRWLLGDLRRQVLLHRWTLSPPYKAANVEVFYPSFLVETRRVAECTPY